MYSRGMLGSCRLKMFFSAINLRVSDLLQESGFQSRGFETSECR